MGTSAPDPLRVLHVSEVHWGGVVTLLRHFVAQQVEAGDDVHVLAPSTIGSLDPGVTLHRWGIDRSRPWTLARAQAELRGLSRRLRPDVVHLHSYFAGALGRAPLRTGVAGVPVVYQPHAWSDQLVARPGAAAAVRRSERLFARQTELLVANCEDELERGRSFGVTVPGRPVGVTVDLARYRPPTAAERATARTTLGIPPDRRLVLVLGRLASQKGQDLLLPAWTAGPPSDTTLALVGPGERDRLAGLAGSELGRSVLMPGETTDPLAWLWAADVMALSSRYETVALVVAEAMASGLPVVATSVDGAEEVLLGGPEDPAGAVVPLGDMAGLVHQVALRLDDPQLRADEGAAGRRRAIGRFSPETVAARLHEAYRCAIARHQGEGR